MKNSLEGLVKNLDRSQFKHTSKYFKGKKLNLMLRKGIYPYEYMTDISKFQANQISSKDKFNSMLSFWEVSEDEFKNMQPSKISKKDYEHAQEVFKTFNCKNVGDYTKLYCLSDVLLLLADVLENFIDVSLKKIKLDPSLYMSAPPLGMDAKLKMTKIELELLADSDMYLFFELGIRGGISTITNRYSKANNPYMRKIRGKTPKETMNDLRKKTNTEQQFSIKKVYEYFPDFSQKKIKALRKKMENGVVFNPQEIIKYIQYLDANNLNGHAMSQLLSIRAFKWLTEEERDEIQDHNKIKSCTLEEDLECPKELHDYHSDYPLAPESIEVNKVKKRIPNLNDKKNVLHYTALNFLK